MVQRRGGAGEAPPACGERGQSCTETLSQLDLRCLCRKGEMSAAQWAGGAAGGVEKLPLCCSYVREQEENLDMEPLIVVPVSGILILQNAEVMNRPLLSLV